jgi:hypothetical protein
MKTPAALVSIGVCLFLGHAVSAQTQDMTMSESSLLVLEESWTVDALTTDKWYSLHKRWGGASPWTESQVSIASVKVWQFDDPGDVRGVLTKDVSVGMKADGNPLKQEGGQK